MKSQKKKKRRPRLPQVLYILFLLASAVYVSRRGGAFSYMLFYFLLFYPLLAILYLLLTRASIRIYQDLDLRELKKFREEPYHLVVENAGLLPAIGIRLFAKRAEFREDMTGTEFSLQPGEKFRFDTGITCRYAGSYEIGIIKLVFNDCFDLIRIPLNLKSPLRVQVLPSFTGDCAGDVEQALKDLYLGSAAGNSADTESILGNDMVPYSPGDPLKRIHWKNYARSRELFVRLPEARPTQMICVVLLSRPAGEDDDSLNARDEFIEYSLSVANAFLSEQRPVQFLFYNAGVKRIPVEDYEGLNRLSFELSKELVLRGEVEESDVKLKSAAKLLSCPVFSVEEGVCKLCPI